MGLVERGVLDVPVIGGSFYDKTGAIRDVVQNHMLQVLATVLAEPPEALAWNPGPPPNRSWWARCSR